MSSAVIFGAAGQDGSFLTELLLKKNYTVTAVIRHTSRVTKDRLSHINDKNLDVILGDVTDKKSVEDIINYIRPDECYNLAAQSQVGLSFQLPEYTFRSIYNGTENILNALLDYSPHTHYYQASSSEMFGNAKGYKDVSYKSVETKGILTFDENETWILDETVPFQPCSPYGVAKVAAHYLTTMYREAYGLHASAGILFNHESERRGELFVTRKITQYLGRYLKDKDNIKPLKLGNLNASRDWGYAKDYVVAMWLMLQRDKPDDYIIATGEAHTVKEFLIECFKRIGEENWQAYVEADELLFRPSDINYLRGDASKAHKILGWKPTVGFSELIDIMLEQDAPKEKKNKSIPLSETSTAT